MHVHRSTLTLSLCTELGRSTVLTLKQEIAFGIGVNEDYLTRVFGQELGISPWDYLTRYRIARAKDLLRDSLDSIGAIGRRVGFPDPAYFSRVFRKHTGMSPREYRNNSD